ncbi:signal peptidase I [Actinomyces oris]|uniref:Signal peptidase I n=1 Tax=Actinomyces oris TaxID=544580 RepID=A0A1Q8WKN2_9ACTO|nr:signal peptidase I [Actinomyces oris]OLO67246.1 signal peptidase I [Actinomyces oris]
MRPVQDGADDVGLDLKQADPSQIGRASRSAITPACSSPSADSPQEARTASENAGEAPKPAPVDDSDEWDYDPFIDPDAEPEPDDEFTELPPSIQPRRQVAPAIPPPQTSPLYQRVIRLVLVVAVVILVPALLRAYVVQIYEIPSGSMERTLRDGDKVAVPMYGSDDVERGDVIVFTDPDDWLHVKEPTGLRGATQRLMIAVNLLPENTGHHLVKRVIGVGGDHVVADGKGSLTVNGVAIKEPYVKDGQSPSLTSFDVAVPQGYVWVMGDNRSNSADSRYHRDDAHGGFVPLKNVVGVARVVFQWTHLSRWGLLGGGERAFSDVPAREATSPAPPSPPAAPTGDGETASGEEAPSQAAEDSSSEDAGAAGESPSGDDGPQAEPGGPADVPDSSGKSSDQEQAPGRTR